MTNIREGNFSGKQGIEDTQEFICCSNYGFFGFHSLFLLSFIVDTKHLGIEDSADGHLVDSSSEMSVAPLRDSVLTFEFSGFLNDWVYSAGSDDFLGATHSSNSGNLGDEVSCCKFTNSWDRCDDFHCFRVVGLGFVNELWFEPSQFFLQVEESFDAASKDFFLVWVIDADSVMDDFHDFAGGKWYFSAPSVGDFSDYAGDFCFGQFFSSTCGGDFKEEFKDCLGEDVVSVCQFIEDIEGDLFDSGFEFSDFLGEDFAFACQEFCGIVLGVVYDFSGVFEEVEGDYFCRDFVGFGFSKGVALEEFFGNQGVDEGNVIGFGLQEVEDVDVVVACGFDADSDFLGIADGLEEGEDFIKSFFGLWESFLIDDVFLCINNTEVQGIKGCIYADEVFKVRHGLSSFPAVSGLKIGNRMLSLPSSMLIRDLCPNQPIGNGESGGQTPLRARSPGVMSSPCFQFFGSIDSLIITKLYPNST